MIEPSPSEATGNLFSHFWTENSSSFAIGSCDTPTTVAPSALN